MLLSKTLSFWNGEFSATPTHVKVFAHSETHPGINSGIWLQLHVCHNILLLSLVVCLSTAVVEDWVQQRNECTLLYFMMGCAVDRSFLFFFPFACVVLVQLLRNYSSHFLILLTLFYIFTDNYSLIMNNFLWDIWDLVFTYWWDNWVGHSVSFSKRLLRIIGQTMPDVGLREDGILEVNCGAWPNFLCLMLYSWNYYCMCYYSDVDVRYNIDVYVSIIL